VFFTECVSLAKAESYRMDSGRSSRSSRNGRKRDDVRATMDVALYPKRVGDQRGE